MIKNIHKDLAMLSTITTDTYKVEITSYWIYVIKNGERIDSANSLEGAHECLAKIIKELPLCSH